MIRGLDDATAASVIRLADAVEPGSGSSLAPLLDAMDGVELARGATLFEAGRENRFEYLVLGGLLRSFVVGVDGKEVTLAFHRGPGVLTPWLARCDETRSLVSCEALAASALVRFEASALVRLMVRDGRARAWGNRVMQAELVRRTRREWSLAAEPAARRLARFREECPGIEAAVPVAIVASYLGITPVSLSRLRSAAPPQRPGGERPPSRSS